jgi:hypothetical protein
MTDIHDPIILPSDYGPMESFILKNKVKLMEQVVFSISYALINNLSSINVFKFEKSDFIVVLDRSTFAENIKNIYDFYIQNELYELCDRVINVQKLLNAHEKEQKTRQ